MGSEEIHLSIDNLGLPPWLRARLPLLSGPGGELLAAGDVAVAAPMQAWLDATGRCLRLASPTPARPR